MASHGRGVQPLKLTRTDRPNFRAQVRFVPAGARPAQRQWRLAAWRSVFEPGRWRAKQQVTICGGRRGQEFFSEEDHALEHVYGAGPGQLCSFDLHGHLVHYRAAITQHTQQVCIEAYRTICF